MIFPNWGAISANIINSQNNKNEELVGSYTPSRKPTKKDWFIASLFFIIPAVILWLGLIITLYITNM